ncbi:MAG: hypothetical protein U1E23_09360 [Reyranellaceae bacterium]
MTPTDLAAAKRAAQSLIWQEDDPDDAKAVLVARAFAALLEERNAVLAERQWRPIETAPDSPPALLVWLADEGFATEAYMRDWESDGEKGRDLFLPAMDQYADEHTVTHWMPMPSRPSLKGGRHE